MMRANLVQGTDQVRLIVRNALVFLDQWVSFHLDVWSVLRQGGTWQLTQVQYRAYRLQRPSSAVCSRCSVP
jgi:hypothetical protein